MENKNAEFRFFYFTSNYQETVSFYRDTLQWKEFRSWDRGHNEKGTIFHSPNGIGFFEIEEGPEIASLQGGLYIEMDVLDEYYEYLVTHSVNITRPLSTTSYGHRSFHFKDPNGLEIGMFQYLREF